MLPTRKRNRLPLPKHRGDFEWGPAQLGNPARGIAGTGGFDPGEPNRITVGGTAGETGMQGMQCRADAGKHTGQKDRNPGVISKSREYLPKNRIRLVPLRLNILFRSTPNFIGKCRLCYGPSLNHRHAQHCSGDQHGNRGKTGLMAWARHGTS